MKYLNKVEGRAQHQYRLVYNRKKTNTADDANVMPQAQFRESFLRLKFMSQYQLQKQHMK